VLNELKPGLDEKLYENALVILNSKESKLDWKRVVNEFRTTRTKTADFADRADI
jgi:hypothetical protein